MYSTCHGAEAVGVPGRESEAHESVCSLLYP